MIFSFETTCVIMMLCSFVGRVLNIPLVSEEYYFRTRSKHLRWGFFENIAKGFQPFNLFSKKFHLKCLNGFLMRPWILFRLKDYNLFCKVLRHMWSQVLLKTFRTPRKLPITDSFLVKLLAANTRFGSEAVAQRCSVKKVFLEISQNSQENTCARVYFLIKLQTWGLYWEFS